VTNHVDVLVLATHPDDAEIAVAGTILKLVSSGRRVSIADMTRGEKATRGTEETRATETEAATARLGIRWRRNLGFPDTAVADDGLAVKAIVVLLRESRPRVFLVPLDKDSHPDHEATGRIARRAFFLAGLAKFAPELGEPFRPRHLIAYPGNDHAVPTFCVDIGDELDRKHEIVRCYESQLTPRGSPGERRHLLRGRDLLERCDLRDRYFGSLCGCTAAEPFVVDGPLALRDMGGLFEG
jgi:bacillithiol biosynthesis deacetylase BshB1